MCSSSLRACSAILFLFLLTACQNPGLLAVDLRTDVLPKIEFDAVRTTFDGDRQQEHIAGDGDYLSAVRVATFEAVPSGTYRLEVELLQDATTVLSRTYVLDLAPGDSGMTVLMTRDCRAFPCPEGLSCLNGACVSERCAVEAEITTCEAEPVCEVDGDCPEAATCARVRCDEGACIREPLDLCEQGEYCDPELGCRNRPPVLDAACQLAGAPAWSNLSEGFTGDEGSADVVVGSEGYPVWLVDTSDGSIVGYEITNRESPSRVVRPGTAGLDIESGIYFERLIRPDQLEGVALFVLSSLQIPEGTRLIGIGPRPLMILARTEILISGELTVASEVWRGWPGSGGGWATGVAGEGLGAGSPGAEAGETGAGGGGSFGGLGSSGGAISSEPVIGLAGGLYGNAELSPLLGGSAGAPGAPGTAGGHRGGHGGGALQLMAHERIAVRRFGVIDASGGGGGYHSVFGFGGGGSGGSLLLEAPVVENAGRIGANGGGGAGHGTNGEDGSADVAPARGSGALSGHHGNDAAGQPDLRAQIAGGGGGGAGRIRINSLVSDESFGPGFLPVVESEMVTFGRLGQCL